MNQTEFAVSKNITQLSESQVAAMDHFVDFLQLREHNASVEASTALSEPSFEAVWSNSEDDVYNALFAVMTQRAESYG